MDRALVTGAAEFIGSNLARALIDRGYAVRERSVEFGKFYDLDTVALRYFTVFGPRKGPHSEYAAVIPKFVGYPLDGKRPVIYGVGEQPRGFTAVENVVEANVLAAEGGVSGKVFNAAYGDRIVVHELPDAPYEILGTDLEPVYDDPRPGDVRHSKANLSKIHGTLGYEPTVRFREGVERTVDFI